AGCLSFSAAGVARLAAPPAHAAGAAVIGVTEGSDGSLTFGAGVNSDSGLTGSIVLNERNFDVTQDGESSQTITIPATATIAPSAVVVSDVIVQGNRSVSTE